jgi:hypothetical protein
VIAQMSADQAHENGQDRDDADRAFWATLDAAWLVGVPALVPAELVRGPGVS